MEFSQLAFYPPGQILEFLLNDYLTELFGYYNLSHIIIVLKFL